MKRDFPEEILLSSKIKIEGQYDREIKSNDIFDNIKNNI